MPCKGLRGLVTSRSLADSAREGPELQQRWRQQVASQLRRRVANGPRPLAAITYLVRGRVEDGLVDIRHLNFIALHDKMQEDGSSIIRCAGYSAASVPWGLKIGGPDDCKFDKNLAISPGPAARGARFDVLNGELLSLALNLDQVLERHSRYPHLPRRQQLRWPKLWAAFATDVASRIEFAGPELEHAHRRNECAAIPPLAGTAAGFALFPLAYVSHAWRQILAIFADLSTIPKRQVISLEPNARNLRGYEDAVEFDLVGSCFPLAAAARRRTSSRRFATAALAS